MESGAHLSKEARDMLSYSRRSCNLVLFCKWWSVNRARHATPSPTWADNYQGLGREAHDLARNNPDSPDRPPLVRCANCACLEASFLEAHGLPPAWGCTTPSFRPPLCALEAPNDHKVPSSKRHAPSPKTWQRRDDARAHEHEHNRPHEAHFLFDRRTTTPPPAATLARETPRDNFVGSAKGLEPTGLWTHVAHSRPNARFLRLAPTGSSRDPYFKLRARAPWARVVGTRWSTPRADAKCRRTRMESLSP